MKTGILVKRGEERDNMKYQIAVIGGGTTGVCAALAAARTGAKVLLVDINGFLGGNAANGLAWLGFHSLDGRRMIGGIPWEMIQALQTMGGATEFRMDPICGSCVGVNPGILKILLHRMVREANIDVRLHSMFLDISPMMDGWRFLLAEKQGKIEIDAETVIDCTDTGDVAERAGVPMHFGREQDGHSQVSSSIIRVSNVDMDAFTRYFKEHPDQLRPFPLSEEEEHRLVASMRTAPIFVMGAFKDIIAQAVQSGADYPRDKLIGTGNALTGELTLVASRVEDVNPNDTVKYSKDEMAGLEQTMGILELLRKYIPGCAHAELSGTGHTIGIRETRHMEGRYLLTGEDLVQGKEFEDTIAHGAYHLDIHSPDHHGLETRKPMPYSIPFRICQPRAVDRLLVAGRTVSASHTAESSIRVIPILGAIGEACGAASGLAAADGVSVSQIDIKKIQAYLRSQNAIL